MSAPLWADSNPYIFATTGANTTLYKVTVDDDYVDSDLTDYVVSVKLDGTSFPFADCASKNNLRVLDSALGSLEYDVEYYDQAGESGAIHVLVPYVYSTQGTSIYIAVDEDLYTTDGSDPDAVWADYLAVYHMDDDAYDNAIITNSDFAVFGLVGGPSAYYYNGKTYYAYKAMDGKIYCTYHSGGIWETPVEVGTNPTFDGFPDGHGGIACIVDSSGIIWVAGGEHDTALKFWKSDSSEDISAWTAQADLSALASYVSFIKVGNDIYGFWRGADVDTGADIEKAWYYRKYSEGEWSAETTIIVPPSGAHNVMYTCYPAHDVSNGRIWFAWSVANANETSPLMKQMRKIYCGYFKISDAHMYSYDGDDLGTVIDGTEMEANCLVTDASSDSYVWVPMVKLDTSGNPYIYYNRSTDTDCGTWYERFIYWTGSAWSSQYDITQTRNWWAHWDMSVTSSSSAVAYGSDVNGRLKKMSWNGSAWGTADTMSEFAGLGELYSIQYVEGGQDALKLLVDFEKVVVGIDSSDNEVERSGTSIDYHVDYSPYSRLLYKSATPSTEATGSFGKAQSFDGTNDFANTWSKIFYESGGTLQVLAKTPTGASLAAASRCLASVNYEDDGYGSRFDITLKDSNAGQAYDGKLYFRVRPNASDAIVGYGNTVFNDIAITSVVDDTNTTNGYNKAFARQITIPEGGKDVVALSFNGYAQYSNGPNFYLEVWTDSENSPGTVVSGSSVKVVPGTESAATVYGYPSTPFHLDAGTYWVVVRWYFSSAANGYLRYDSDSGVTQNRAGADVNSSTGAISSAWTVASGTIEFEIDIYESAYHLFGISQDSTDGNKLWVDGAAESVTYTTGAASTKDWFDDYPRGSQDITWWYFGKRKDGATNDSFYSNIIDEIRFQNRQRTAAEWKADYHGLVTNDLIIYGN